MDGGYSPVIGAGAADQEARRQRLPVLLRAAAALPRQRDAAARAGGHRCDHLLFVGLKSQLKQPKVWMLSVGGYFVVYLLILNVNKFTLL